jgi:hypothetical protein
MWLANCEMRAADHIGVVSGYVCQFQKPTAFFRSAVHRGLV